MIKNRIHKKRHDVSRFKYKLDYLFELYENNYLKIIDLLNTTEGSFSFSYKLPRGNNYSIVSINIKRNSKYTSTLYIFQRNDYLESVPDLEIEALIFNDLRMIEVKKINKEILLWSRYKYPNSRMFSKDEKYQWNYFFSQWLSNSLKEGLATDYQKKYVPL
tara:strand:- start:105 stop:587 length:483 start_codon:yes stop_codon:yes gene_type:complete